MNQTSILIDSCALVAYYSEQDVYHDIMCRFLAECTSELITTTSCITETMWLLDYDYRVQNEFLDEVLDGVYIHETLTNNDLRRIIELNKKYADRKPDFADLSLVAVSERLDIPAIATFDKDFQVYRRYRNQPFVNVLA
jgi:uncharacterized protein